MVSFASRSSESKNVKRKLNPLVDNQLRKEVFKTTKLRKKYYKNSSEPNEVLYNKQRNECVSLRRRCINPKETGLGGQIDPPPSFSLKCIF